MENNNTKEKNNKNKMKRSVLFNEDELTVAEILADLANIVSTSESRRSKFEWVGKKKRSSLDAAGASSSRAPYQSLQPTTTTTPEEVVEETTRHHQVQVAVKSAVTATASPDTPLSFSPSESDDENNNTRHSSKKNSKKISRKQYVELVDQLTERRDCLRGEIENVRKYYNKLKTLNTELKAMKQEVLKTSQSKEESQMETQTSRLVNYPMEQAHRYQVSLVHHQPFVTDQAFQYPIGPITAQFYNNGLGMVNDVGPLGIPDLNIAAEEVFGGGVEQPQPLDVNRAFADRRARFAEARRLRRGMIKIKSMRNACGIKLPRIS